MNNELKNKLDKLVCHITSNDPSNSSFGTGFILKQEGNISYLLTCAHVVKDVGGSENVRIKNASSIEVVVNGFSKGIDLALLKVTGLEKCSVLPLTTSGGKGTSFFLRGFSEFKSRDKEGKIIKGMFAARTLEGNLGDQIRIEPPEVVAWDLSIKTDDGFAMLVPGYSGSPVCDSEGFIFAVVIHSNMGTNKGRAMAVANLKNIWSDMPENWLSISKVARPFDFFAYDSYWVGREKLVGELSALLRGQNRLLLILGLTGIGKTALAEKLVSELEDWLGVDWKNRFRRANFDYDEKPTDFVTVATRWLEEWGEKLTPEDTKPERLLNRLVKRLCDKRVLVLIDSMERLLTGNKEEDWGDFADEWWKKFFFQILSVESCESRIIVTSQDLPVTLDDSSRYQTFISRCILYGLDENEQEALFKITGFDVSEDSPNRSILFRLGKAYEGHPLVLRVILGEILSAPFNGDVQMYWEYDQENVDQKIEDVEEAIEEAKQGKTDGKEDEWKLHQLTRGIREKVNKQRLQIAFNRLKRDINDAYILICAASVYRTPEKETYWLEHLKYWLNKLENQECDKNRQNKAVRELINRFLVEISKNHNNKVMLGQHNLIRSVAIEHRKQFLEGLKTGA